MKSYRCTIIGCGGRGRMHALAYKHVPEGRLAACCDRNPENLEKFSQEFGLTPYRSAAEMLEREKPDLVHLVTAPSTRVELMTLVDHYQVPLCIVEKPIAIGVRDWRALVSLEARSRTRFGVGAQFRYHPVMNRLREALRSGKLGEVRFLDCSAGGTICDQGVHVLDWAMSLIEDSPVVSVFGAASGVENLTHPVHPAPDNSVAKLTFANGASGMWHLGEAAPRVVTPNPAGVKDSPVYYKHCRVAAYAGRGHALYEEFGRWEILSPDGLLQGSADDLGWAEGNHLAQANLTKGMFAWLEDESKAVGTNLTRSLLQWNAILGLYASTVWRRPVDLPFDPPDDLWEQLGEELKN